MFPRREVYGDSGGVYLVALCPCVGASSTSSTYCDRWCPRHATETIPKQRILFSLKPDTVCENGNDPGFISSKHITYFASFSNPKKKQCISKKSERGHLLRKVLETRKNDDFFGPQNRRAELAENFGSCHAPQSFRMCLAASSHTHQVFSSHQREEDSCCSSMRYPKAPPREFRFLPR